MKQQGVFLPIFGAVVAVVHGLSRRPRSWRKLSADLAIFSAGAVLPYAATCLWLWRAGVFDRFWFWTVTYARQYVQQNSLEVAWGCFYYFFLANILVATWPVWAAALVGLVVAWWPKANRKAAWFAAAFLTFSVFCVCPGFFFRNHYFIICIPAVAIFCGVACSVLLRLTARWRPGFPNRPRHVEPLPSRRGKKSRSSPAADVAWAVGPLLGPAILLILTVSAMLVYWDHDYFFSWSPTRLCQRIYSPNPFVESLKIADYIQCHTTPDQTIAVIGSEPQLFFLSHRKSATGYIYTYALVEQQDFASQMQREMIAEIEQSKPALIVFVNIWASWLTRPNPDLHIFQWLARYANNYRVVGLVNMTSQYGSPEYYWDEAAAQAKPRSQYCIWIMRRNN